MADRARQSGCTTTAGRLQCDLWPHEDDPTSMHWDSTTKVWWQTEGEHIGHVAFSKGQWAAACIAQGHKAAAVEATRLLAEARTLREHAPSSSPEWRAWDKQAEAFLRARGDGASDD